MIPSRLPMLLRSRRVSPPRLAPLLPYAVLGLLSVVPAVGGRTRVVQGVDGVAAIVPTVAGRVRLVSAIGGAINVVPATGGVAQCDP